MTTHRTLTKTQIDLTGQRYGKLLIICWTTHPKNGTGVWLARCDCGNETYQRTNDIQSKTRRRTSCGCARDAHKQKEKGHAGAYAAYGHYRHSAKVRNLEFSLDFEKFKELVQMRCFYCNDPPSLITEGSNRRNKEHARYVRNGLDRIDNNIGYLLSNLVTCCKNCNYAKKDLSQDVFYAWLARAYLHTFGDKS